jgi:hypothetical protein
MLHILIDIGIFLVLGKFRLTFNLEKNRGIHKYLN